MRENTRLKQQRFELALNLPQACGIVVVGLAVVASAFYLGTSVGRWSASRSAGPAPAPRDALARLDEPIAREEAPPELKAHQVLTDSRPLDAAMPVAARASSAPQADRGKGGSGEVDPVLPPQIAQGGNATAPAAAPASPAPVATAAPTPAVAQRPAPPARPAAPAAAAYAAPAGRYTIQVGSSPHREEAEKLARRHAARHAHVVAADVPGKGRWYRVQLGSYDSREAARHQLATLARAGVQGIVTQAR